MDIQGQPALNSGAPQGLPASIPLGEAEPDEDYFRRPELVRDRLALANPCAVLADQFGAVALFPCFGVLLGPLALGLGLYALTCSHRYAAGQGAERACKGIVLGTVGTLLNLGGIAFLVLGDIFLW